LATGIAAVIVALVLALPVNPLLSVTVSDTVYVPGVA